MFFKLLEKLLVQNQKKSSLDTVLIDLVEVKLEVTTLSLSVSLSLSHMCVLIHM